MKNEKTTFSALPVVENAVLRDVCENLKNNKVIIDYYTQYYREKQSNTIFNKIENVTNCSKFWDIEHYQKQKIKNITRLNCCKDKFCYNCKKIKQASRLTQYMPIIQSNKENLYFVTLTVPNICGSELHDTIKTMTKAFRKLIKIIRGDYDNKWLDFGITNYKGAIRSLEITFHDDDYHPHYHVLLSADVDDQKQFINQFSYHYGVLKTEFSFAETQLQKIWYLLINGKKITRKNMENADIYSCKIDKADENNIFEVFKYLTKSTNENGALLSYENFKVLYESTYRVKQIQGYGIFYHVTDTDEIMESLINEYKTLLQQLQAVEMPKNIINSPGELLQDKDNKIISFKAFVKTYKENEKIV